jgi:hypothetical protein
VAAEDFRVEVELDDEQSGYSLWERLRARHLKDEVQHRLGDRVVVTRDGSQLFLYAATERSARDARKAVQGILDEDGVVAEVTVTRWHPVEEEWEDVSVPLPQSAADERAEYEERVAEQAAEAAEEGEYDWQVIVHASSRDGAAEVAERLAAEGFPVARRWRYVVVGALTEEAAEVLADRLRGELSDAEVEVGASLNDVPAGPFQFIGF